LIRRAYTGFLGSAKTTLINAALRAPELASTLVVVNEFDEVGLDQKLFARSSDAVVALENGCLCCTVKSDLVGTLNQAFHARQAGEIPAFDNVVIKTSGLAEPGPVLQGFLSEPTLEGLYRVASVLTLVDAVNREATARDHDEWTRQVALADHIRRPRRRPRRQGRAEQHQVHRRLVQERRHELGRVDQADPAQRRQPSVSQRTRRQQPGARRTRRARIGARRQVQVHQPGPVRRDQLGSVADPAGADGRDLQT
jgi:hypothetical protein